MERVKSEDEINRIHKCQQLEEKISTNLCTDTYVLSILWLLPSTRYLMHVLNDQLQSTVTL